MSKENQLEAHIFVCTNLKPEGKPCCAAKGAVELRDLLKTSCKNEPWASRVRVNASGCLGKCEEGITAVIYPQAKWFTHLTKNDQVILKNALIEVLN